MIQPGLERIGQLLKNIHFPWKSIHVAGTNGKGSICAYASSLLTRRHIRHGRFTSPHLIDRWDCIQVNGEPVSERDFRKVENHFTQLNQRENIGASEFELLTATAFQLFNDNKIDIGVVEVGMGGKLDATNILNNQIVSVISKIAHDHQNFLGNTLEDIARHKAGILRPNVPYIVNPVNEWNIHDVIDHYAKEIGAGPRILPDTPELRQTLFKKQDWTKVAERLLPFQRDNVVLAYLAFLEALNSLRENTQKASRLLVHLRSKTIPGRFQEVGFDPILGTQHSMRRRLVVDGAHNPDAGKVLAEWIRRHYRRNTRKKQMSSRDYRVAKLTESSDGESQMTWKRSVTWVLAMTEGKDARKYLETILEPGDSVVTTTFGPVDGMPWVKPMDPKELSKIVQDVEPGVTSIDVPLPGTFRALCTAKYLAGREQLIVITGSLYLVSDFLRLRGEYTKDPTILDTSLADKEARNRVNTFLSKGTEATFYDAKPESDATSIEAEKRKLEAEIEMLDREMQSLEVEETRLRRARSLSSTSPVSDAASSLSAPPAPPSAEGDGTMSAKAKFYRDFEDIRTQLEQLPPSLGTSELSPTNDLRPFIYKREPSADTDAILRGAERPRVRYHMHEGKPQKMEDYKSAEPFHSPADDQRLERPDPHRPSIVYPRANTRLEGKARIVEARTKGRPVVKSLHPLKLHLDDSGDCEQPIQKSRPAAYIRKHPSRAAGE
ncbi:FolC bifunctional protein [Byssothecium circinans]|uniref:FolC bifunctional protein n=1 Tax=Byssothecium circinans TaxID=147558 RepID=A0A6A5TUL3_9PLEO|nr:FolC bifunctional protein [Byssothecium circinans]